jgi:uncharacterized protein (DUF305 family)
MRTTSTTTHIAALVAGIASTAILSACGATTGAPAPAGPATASAEAAAAAEHNDADIRFAQTMITHHRQAIQMAELAGERAESQPVKDLAEQIRTAQEPEIATLTTFLVAWGAEVPTDEGIGAMDHGDMGDTSGMMTPEQMNQMSAASGAAFDRLFLQMMIVHHQGAVADAQTELTEGNNQQAKELAQKIIDNQTPEITQMQQLLQGV